MNNDRKYFHSILREYLAKQWIIQSKRLKYVDGVALMASDLKVFFSLVIIDHLDFLMGWRIPSSSKVIFIVLEIIGGGIFWPRFNFWTNIFMFILGKDGEVVFEEVLILYNCLNFGKLSVNLELLEKELRRIF